MEWRGVSEGFEAIMAKGLLQTMSLICATLLAISFNASTRKNRLEAISGFAGWFVAFVIATILTEIAARAVAL